MLERIIAWSLSHRYTVLAGAAVVCLVGYVAVSRLVIDAFPDTTPVQVQINTVASGMVAEEVERQITFPVELAMGGMPGLEEIRSASMFGLSVVIVTFRDGKVEMENKLTKSTHTLRGGNKLEIGTLMIEIQTDV